ncbi:MAG TPA: DUF397 domain-containing protein [Micromonosporaceae bacterium]|nr:DUF397 domain-containing protein [Micromonosporaceae bacterium]
MTRVTVPDLRWARSSRCDGGHCVEVAVAEAVYVRDSKDVAVGTLRFERSAWRAFLAALPVDG